MRGENGGVKNIDPNESSPFLERVGNRDLGDAVDEAREIVDFTTRQVRDARSLVESIQSPLLKGLVVSFILLTFMLVGIVIFREFRSWYMFLALFSVQFVFFLLYTKAHFSKRRFSRIFFLFATGVSGLFSMVILHDKIEPRTIWYEGALVYRDEVGALWAPIILLGLWLLVLLFHFFVVGKAILQAEALDD